MIRSMTGFGDAQLAAETQIYHVEIRSVNNRYFKASIHLPDEFGFLEPDVDRLIRECITRGSVVLRLHRRDLSPNAAQEINAAAMSRYVEQMQVVRGKDETLVIDLAKIALLPGVCQPREVTETERESTWKLVSGLIETAVDRMLAMRATEGKALADDLLRHVTRIREHLTRVRERAPLVVQEYRDRLMARIQELLSSSNVRLAEQDLLKEVSIYAERSDISEEISRLAAHLDQVEECLSSREPAGRKLDFLSQELLREANTMGAKASDAQIARDIIEIKIAIDRVKEQVQNVE